MPYYKTIFFSLLIIGQLATAASTEQVEQYLTASQAEEELLALQSQFTAMQNSFSHDTNNSKTPYDLQMLSIRFRDYLERNISEDEMTEILDNYRNVSLMHFINASSEAQNHEQNETKQYASQLKSDSDAAIRINLIDKISEKFYPKEGMIKMFDGLMKPLIQNGIGGDSVNDEMLKASRENYTKMMLKTAKEETLFATRDFEMKELEALMEIAKTPAVDHESKAVFGAMTYALKDFFLSMASRYDVSKHTPRKTNKEEPTK